MAGSPQLSLDAGREGASVERRLRALLALGLGLPAALRRDDGQALTEYALILLLVAIVCITALNTIGMGVNDFLNDTASKI